MLSIREPLADHDLVTPSVQTSKVGLFQDIPKWIWISFLSTWATLFGLFIVFFATNSASAFVVTIAALFGLMAFGLPMTLATLSNGESHNCTETIHTHTGPLTIVAAAAQILLIPIAAVIGLIAFILLTP